MKRIGLLIVLGVGFSVSALAQGNEPPMYNPNSVTPIAEYEQLYRKRVWRRMDLKEKQNQSFFAHSKEITKLIIEAVDRGEIFPYTNNDSLNVRMSKEEFFERLQLEDLGGQDDPFGDLGGDEPTDDGGDGWGDTGGGGDGWGDSGGGDGWGDSGGAEGGQEASGSGSDESAGGRYDDYYLPTDVTVIEIMEDIIFDKRRARLYYDIQSFKLILPAELKTTGLLTEVATFRYKDLEELFRGHPEEAIWFNPQNNAEHKNFADAFSLRLHSSRITKIQNTNNLAIVDIYDQNEMRALIASQQLEFELMEKEHDLWEQ